MSLVSLGLGDRVIIESALRLHRKNRPGDYFIAILDKHGIVDLPYASRRHFDELWWVDTGRTEAWKGCPRSAVGQRIRDALIADKVDEILTAAWGPKQVPRNTAYAVHRHNCICEANYLRDLRYRPEVIVPSAERRWAREHLQKTIPGGYEALASVHVRNYPNLPEKNLDPGFIEEILTICRTVRRFGFILVGRDDGPPGLSGPDIHSFVGRQWSCDRTAALIAETRLFIGGDSGPTHTAAGLGVPVVGFGCYGDHLRPFTNPDRFVYFQMNGNRQAVLKEIRRFVRRVV